MNHLAPSFLSAALSVCLGLAAAPVGAQDQKPMYRCDVNGTPLYTNTLPDGKAQGCKLVEGGNVTVVQGLRVPASAAPGKAASASQASPPGAPKVEAGDQKARDSDARQILEAELKKAEARKADLAREYNNGEPEKRGDEARNHQKYLDRVTELKASLARVENDIAGIRRELGRAGGGAVSTAPAAK
jgi:hypothetical protein